ncbi:MAG: hypothetical protein WCB14_06750, partial [Candidatus Acidiferrales bacterium]
SSAGEPDLTDRSLLSDQIIVQYVGFEEKGGLREYAFTVREPSSEPLDYTLTIFNEAFVAHRARYQDAPDICSLRLRRELATNANHPPTTHFSITDAEMAEYHDARKQKPLRSFQPRRDD